MSVWLYSYTSAEHDRGTSQETPKDDAEAVLGVHMNLRVEFGEEFCCGFHMSIRTSQDLYHAFALQ
jgi:hypothetical protein